MQLGGYDGKGAYNFDGVDDLILIPDRAELNFSTNPFSVSLWVYADGYIDQGSGWNTIFSKGTLVAGSSNGFYGMFIANNNLSYFIIDDASGAASQLARSSTSIADGNWHHLVGVRDEEGNVLIYHNAVLQSTQGTFTGEASIADDLYIATDGIGGLSRFINATIDEFVLYCLLNKFLLCTTTELI